MSLTAGILMGEETTLTPASSDKRKKSLRTIFPISFVRQFELKEGDRLRWKLQAEGDEFIVIARPVKGGRKRQKRMIDDEKTQSFIKQ
jgi:hypothetical protein